MSKKKYYWYFWMIFIIVFSLGTALVIVRHHGNQQHYDRINTYLQNTARQLNIDGFEQVKQMLRGVAKQTFVVSTAIGNKSPDNPEILAAMLSVSSALNASIVYLLDNKGTVVACTPYGNGKTLTGENYVFRPYFTSIIGGDNSTFYAALGVTTGERGIYISIPVKDGETLSGVLVAKLGLAVVDSSLKSITSPVVMISSDGVVFATNKKEWLYKTVLPMTQSQQQSLRKTKQFATEELLPLGYDFSQADLTLGKEKYNLTSTPVMDGKWRLIGLFKPPVLNAVVFGLCAFAIWSFVALISFGCRFYYGLILSEKKLKDIVQQLNSEITERKQSEAVIKIKSKELEGANKELIAATEDLQAKKQSLLNEKIFAEALLECLPGYLYVYDDQGNLVRWNKKHETMTGYSAEELSQKNMSDWFEGEDAVRVAAAVDEVFTTGYGEVEAHLLIKGGEKLFIHSNGVKLTIDGKTYFVGVGIDITERKQAEADLRKSEARQGKMAANIGDVIVIIDQEGINRYKSPNIEKLFGWKLEDVVGEKTWDNVHPDDLESTKKFFEKIVLFPDTVGTMECRYRCGDGSYKWIEFTGTNLFHDPDIQGLLGNYHDITERKRFEDVLEKRILALTKPLDNEDGITFNELFNIIEIQRLQDEFAQATGVASIITDTDGKPITTPSNFCRLCRDIIRKTEKGLFNCYKSDAVLGRNNPDGPTIQTCLSGGLWDAGTAIMVGGRHIANWLIGQVRDQTQTDEKMREYARDIGADEEDFIHAFHEIPAMSREQFEKVSQALFTLAKQLSSIAYQNVQQARFITERKQAEEEREKLQDQLTQAQKMESIGRLAGGVAHDFNNMLSIILGNTEMILDDLDSANPVISNLHEIHKATERSANLTRQLLAFARKQTISPKVLDLNETIEGMLKMLRRLIGENIDLAWLPKISLWAIKLDPSQVDQILANLCVNARDSIKDVGKVTIETDNVSFDNDYCHEHDGFKPGDYVMIAVSDNGCGMGKEILDNLFEPFFTTKGVGEGTGLGLATVYGIVKQNNGFINVYSEPDKGTTFRIYFPRHAENNLPKQKPESKKADARGCETILLVEDETAILKMTAMMLERQGYTVLAASNTTVAINIGETHLEKIDLLMTDVVMPGMNGRDLAKKMFQLFPDLKCLFMSGYTANVIAHHGVLDDGMQFIQKPFSRQDLAAKVREVIDEN